MKFTVEQIAQIINGTVEGNKTAIISKFNKIEEGTPESISFLANPKYESYLYDSEATAIIVAKDLTLKSQPKASLIRVDEPYLAFTLLLQKYQELIASNESGIHPQSYLANGVEIGENVLIGAFSEIDIHSNIGDNTKIHSKVSIGKNVKIGNNCVIFPGVVIYSDTIIGNHCVLHANAVIGSDGFGFAPKADGTYSAIPQLGNVILEDFVSVGSNTTIDRATMGSTKIGKGVKIDNLVQIAHNVEIGANTVIAAQTGISGSTKVGENCMIGGQVGVAGHISIAPNTVVTAQSGVTKSVKNSGLILGGTPASTNSEYLKRNALIRKLPEIFEKFNQLEK
ncbi:UDP-3-O-(3-hydroxymyristoyl)glucosamine N-acyltransferase [Aquirufa sp. ROCK2-A2]